MSELEDLYLPYRPKRKTKASVAIEKGLEPLAKIVMRQGPIALKETAAKFVNLDKGVRTSDEALAGARDIMAEWVSENIHIRESLRNSFKTYSVITTKVLKGKEEEGEKYGIYFNA